MTQPENKVHHIDIEGRRVGPGCPVYIVAEISANHNHDLSRALEMIRAAKEAGADAVKIQTYTADTMTIDCDEEPFLITGGTPWDGRILYDLYQEAYTPWEWTDQLQRESQAIGIDLFSTPFDPTAVDFLEELHMPAHKIASFELVDLPLIEKVSSTGKPIILSTGMATLEEIEEAVTTARNAGARSIALLKCTSAYPSPASQMNLRTIPDLIERFRVPVGLSDHTLGTAAAIAAVSLGACIVEKHFTLSRSDGGPDSAFSLEPPELGLLVSEIRDAEAALGSIEYGLQPDEHKSMIFRRSLFVVEEVKAGELLSDSNVRSIRPGYGLHPRHLKEVIGGRAGRDIKRGTPMGWDLLD